jgi:hypothetical protein
MMSPAAKHMATMTVALTARSAFRCEVKRALISLEDLPDDLVLADLKPQMRCAKCGRKESRRRARLAPPRKARTAIPHPRVNLRADHFISFAADAL